MLNEQQRQQVREAFPGVTDDDLNQSDEGALAESIAASSGQSRQQVEQRLRQITQQS